MGFASALVARVEDFADLGGAFFKPISELAPGKRVQTALALSLNTDFDAYLADDMNVSNTIAFREKCDAALMDRLEGAGLIMLSRHPAQDVLTILTNEDHPTHAIA